MKNEFCPTRGTCHLYGDWHKLAGDRVPKNCRSSCGCQLVEARDAYGRSERLLGHASVVTTEMFYTNTTGALRKAAEAPEERTSGLHHLVHPGRSAAPIPMPRSPFFRGSGARLFSPCNVVGGLHRGLHRSGLLGDHSRGLKSTNPSFGFCGLDVLRSPF